MIKEKIFSSLEKVFSLMIENRLREDIDDTLLEKLLSLINTHIHNMCKRNCEADDNSYHVVDGDELFETLQISTQAHKLIEKSILSIDTCCELSTSITAFALRLLCVIIESEDYFKSVKESNFLLALHKSFEKDSTKVCSPSVQNALLDISLSLAKHTEGSIWIIKSNVLKFIFSRLSCSSYYVRKTAIRCYIQILDLWISKSFNCSEQYFGTNKDIVHKLVNGIHLSEDQLDTRTSECCLSILQQVLDKPHISEFIHKNVSLHKEMLEYFEKAPIESLMNTNADNLLLIVLKCNNNSGVFIGEFVNILIRREFYIPALNLATSFLSTCEQYKPYSPSNLYVLLLPLYILSGSIFMENSNDVFHLKTEKIFFHLIEEFEDKSKAMKLISLCFENLANLTNYMSLQALKVMVDLMEIIVVEPKPLDAHIMTQICLESRSVCLSLTRFMNTLLFENVYSVLHNSEAFKLFGLTLTLLEKSSLDCNVLSEVLRIFKSLIFIQAKYNVSPPDALKDKLVQNLCRKLLDKREQIVDSALMLSEQVLTGEDQALWEKTIFKHQLHQIIWEIGIDGFPAGFVKASALRVITQMCLVSSYWNDIISSKNINEVKMVEIFRDNFFHSDYLVQREAVSCMKTWIGSNKKLLPLHCMDIFFQILSTASVCLDLELKLNAMKGWQNWLEDEYFNPQVSDIHAYLKRLCDSGCSACILSGLDDYDDAVQNKTANIVINIRKHLLSWKDVDLEFNESNKINVTELETVSESYLTQVSKQQKIAVVDDLLNTPTAQHITDIYLKSSSTIPEEMKKKETQNKSTSCSSSVLWNSLWSEKVENILKVEKPSCNLYSEYSLSLLEDIIAAEKVELFHYDDETLDCY